MENKRDSSLIFNLTYPEIDMSVFKECDGREFYGDVSEPIPPSARVDHKFTISKVFVGRQGLTVGLA